MPFQFKKVSRSHIQALPFFQRTKPEDYAFLGELAYEIEKSPYQHSKGDFYASHFGPITCIIYMLQLEDYSTATGLIFSGADYVGVKQYSHEWFDDAQASMEWAVWEEALTYLESTIDKIKESLYIS